MEARVRELIEAGVDTQLIPTLMEYIKVPSQSPAFDPDWESNGLLEQAQDILINYVKSLDIEGFTYELIKHPGAPPLFFGEVQASAGGKGTVLIYGHMDKQPPFTGWMDGLGPTTPVLIDNKLYGRGAVDDGYSLPGAALVIKTMQTLGIPHGRIVLLAENEEESGSKHLRKYIDELRDRIGHPELVICLDTGGRNYEQLWTIISLRGLLTVDLTVAVLSAGQHSGSASGIAPSTFRILRELLDRLEDSRTGEIKVAELHAPLSPALYHKVVTVVEAVGDRLYDFPWLEGVQPVTSDHVEALLNRSYRPVLSVVGADGLPDMSSAGNVLRPHTSVRLSIRLPPGVNPEVAGQKVVEVLTSNPPYAAKVSAQVRSKTKGWGPKVPSEWLHAALDEASMTYFEKPSVYFSAGGSIPLIGMLDEIFPAAEFVLTGVLGPGNNSHSANEMLRVDFLKTVLCCIVHVLAMRAQR